MSEVRWFEVHENIAALARWMADQGFSASEVADAVEKPWKYHDEYTRIEEVAE